jgi:hypothetical protein
MEHVRLVNIYLFRCSKKILFVTSSFVGWLIGRIIFMKWIGVVSVWIQKNNSILFFTEYNNLTKALLEILMFCISISMCLKINCARVIILNLYVWMSWNLIYPVVSNIFVLACVPIGFQIFQNMEFCSDKISSAATTISF